MISKGKEFSKHKNKTIKEKIDIEIKNFIKSNHKEIKHKLRGHMPYL